MDGEEWRPVDGFAGVYDVSDLGRIWSRPRVVVRGGGSTQTIPGKIMECHKSAGGRDRDTVSLRRAPGERRIVSRRRIVWEAFKGAIPPDHYVCSLFADDFSVGNLFMISQEELVYGLPNNLRHTRGAVQLTEIYRALGVRHPLGRPPLDRP